MRKLLAVPAVAAICLAATACGSSTFDTSNLQKTLSENIANATSLKSADLSVKCPKDQSANKGDTFTCTVSTGGQTQDVAITVTDDDGGVSWELQ